MAYLHHGFRVKHLNGTSGCPHYAGLEADAHSTTKCATNGCGGYATRACHVIMANQNDCSGNRWIVYCCAKCNGQKKGQVNNIRSNGVCYELPCCDCGYL